MAVIVEAAVAVNGRVRPFKDDFGPTVLVQSRCEVGPGGALHTMHRPQDLLEALQLYRVSWLLAGMICRKAGMIGGMPIPSCSDQVEFCLQPVDQRDHFISARHSQRSPRNEVILNVYQNQGVHFENS